MFKLTLNRIFSYSRFCHGATAIEYSLIVAAIALAIVGVVFLLGDELQVLFQELIDSFST